MPVADPEEYRYANEEKVNRRIDSFPPDDRALVREYINTSRAQKGIKLVRVLGIIDGLKAWQVIIKKPFQKWTRNDVYQGVTFVRDKKKLQTIDGDHLHRPYESIPGMDDHGEAFENSP